MYIDFMGHIELREGISINVFVWNHLLKTMRRVNWFLSSFEQFMAFQKKSNKVFRVYSDPRIYAVRMLSFSHFISFFSSFSFLNNHLDQRPPVAHQLVAIESLLYSAICLYI